MNPTLYVGDKNYSSWSLRAWLCLEWSDLEYDEVLIELSQPGYGMARIAEVLEVSPSGRVPALRTDTCSVWDSLTAIAEWASEHGSNSLWPSDPDVRAVARSATCEMHSGFPAIRTNLPMNIHGRRNAPPWDAETLSEIRRVVGLWTDCRAKHGARGPWLFGERSVADAFYTPVATRFRTYATHLEGPAQAYCKTLLEDEAFLRWQAQAKPNSWDREGYPKIDGLYEDREAS